MPRPEVPERIDYSPTRELPEIAMRPISESPEVPEISTLPQDRQPHAFLWYTSRRSAVLAECRFKHESLVEWIREGE